MGFFGTKTNKNQLLRIKLLPNLFFEKILMAWKNFDYELSFTIWPKSKQIAEKY